jgi:hypothetical protein
MSYSFTVTGASKAAAKQLIADSFANVVSSQPSHAADRDAAVSTASAFVDTLAEPSDGSEIVVSMNGSLGWRQEAPEQFLHASVSAHASLRPKAAG